MNITKEGEEFSNYLNSSSKKANDVCPYCGSMNHASIIWNNGKQYHRTCLDCHKGFNYGKNGKPTK